METKKQTQSEKNAEKVMAAGTHSSKECCPMCGSEDYAGGSVGGRCMECGYSFGFHGTSEFQHGDD